MEIISQIALITINETIIAQIVSFVILVFILNRIMIRPLRNVIDERESYLSKIKQDVIDAQGKMDELTQALSERETDAKKEAFGLKSEMEKAGNQQAVVIFDDARKMIEEMKRKADQAVEEQIDAAKKKIALESETLSVNIMEKILERRLAS